VTRQEYDNLINFFASYTYSHIQIPLAGRYIYPDAIDVTSREMPKELDS
jgi:hypothetical protein